jgi:hypothetical protein
MDDPSLEAAADTVRPWLESSFAGFFAGIEVEHEEHVMIIYRRPNPQLDAQVAEQVGNVQVVVRDARYSLIEMTTAIDRLLADERYWRDRGMAINGVSPAVDGSGVTVLTAGDPEELTDGLTTRYSDMAFVVRQQTVGFPIWTSPLPVWGQTP